MYRHLKKTPPQRNPRPTINPANPQQVAQAASSPEFFGEDVPESLSHQSKPAASPTLPAVVDPLGHADRPEAVEVLPKRVMDKKIDALSPDDAAFAVLRQFRQARADFGLARMKMGAYLHIIRENKMWQGVAENWEAFIASENINVHAARQYINVAKKFIFEMDLPDESLGQLSLAGITALEKASKVITEENQEEFLETLSSLSERDAIQRIIELSSGDNPEPAKPSARVLRLLRDFYELPPDMQIEFRQKIVRNGHAKKAGN